MRRSFRVLLGVLIALVAVILIVFVAGVILVRRPWPQTDGTIDVAGLHSEVQIVRDEWGVPHVYASTPHDLFFAQGFVHAQDRFWQMEFWRRIGAGRLAEILGESALSSDKFIRTLGWHRTAARELVALGGEERAALEAYADGVNAYIGQRKGRLGLEFTILGLTGVRIDPEPWTPLNTLTWAKVMAWDLGGNMNDELLRAHVAARLGTAAVNPLTSLYPADSPVIMPQPMTGATLDAIPSAAFDTHVIGSGPGIGSNNWVVAGSRTETGMPLLCDDMHLGIQMPSIWYEIGLHCQPQNDSCPFNVSGFSFAGAPGVIVGHNDRIAWGVTNLGPDVQDLYVERVNPEHPNQYEYLGQWMDMETIREEILVAGRDEEEGPEIVTVRLTRHGPIINDIVGGSEDHWDFGWQPLALSWTALEPGNLFRSVFLLNKASNWEEFRQALSFWDFPSQNFVYADTEGNIGYQAPGRIPIRASGNGSAPVAGWTGEYEWTGYVPFEEMPRSFNPSEGYIVTANNAVVGPDFPYFISMDWSPGYRAQRIIELIQADSSLSVDDMKAIQGDSNSAWAASLMPHVREFTSSDPALTEALSFLKAWDGRSDRDSAAALLFEAFALHLVDQTFEDELGQQLLERARPSSQVLLASLLDSGEAQWFDDTRTAPIESRDDIMLAALEGAVDELTESMGKNMARWRWGDRHTATFENQSLGQSGIGPIEALFNRGPVAVDGGNYTVNATGWRLSQPYQVNHVTSQRMIVDLSDMSESLTMHTTGQSGHAFHPHYDDMIDPWRNIEFHPMYWDRRDAEANADGILKLEPRANP